MQNVDNMTIYHKFHSSRKKEHDFLDWLLRKFPKMEFVNENYDISAFDLKTSVEIPDILQSLKYDKFLPAKKKSELVKVLEGLPEKVIVLKSLSDISVDFVIIKDTTPYFIELHEDQHKKLSVSRLKNIYTLTGEIIKVPRFVQRFIRDIWRIENIPNYSVIWYDWFSLNKESFNFEFTTNFKEHYLDKTFSFDNFKNTNHVGDQNKAKTT